ncbi:MAG TPA: hypothetical protein VGC42_23390 [Kofleriaceae bacterium]
MMELTSDLLGRLDAVLRRTAPDALAELARVARSILECVAAGANVSAVYHPLGFVSVPLAKTRDTMLRLHFWDPEVGSTPLPFHCHRWHLTGYVVCGHLQNKIIAATPAAEDLGDATRLRVYREVVSPRSDEFERTDELVRPELRSLEDVRAGQRYTMDAGLFHTTVNPTGQALVTVIMVNDRGQREMALGPVDGEPRYRLQRSPCQPSDVRARSARILESL